MFGLMLLLIVGISMNMIFSDLFKETFKGGIGIDGLNDIGYNPIVRQNTLNGNMKYSGSGFMAASPYPTGDDQQLFYGFSN